jgi:hypothetical protein
MYPGKLRTGSTLEFGVHDAKRLGFVVVLIVVSSRIP